MPDHDPTNTTPPDPTPASKPRVRLWLTTEEAMALLGVNDSDTFAALAKEEKFTVSAQNGDTEYLRSDLMARRAKVEAAEKAAADEKAKEEAKKKAPDAPPTGPKKSEETETHTAKCRCGCRIRTRAGATATVGDIHVHLPAPAPSEEKHTAKMPWWLIPLVVLATLLGLWLLKGLVSGGGKDTAAVPAADAKVKTDTAKSAATVDPDATTPPPAAKAVDDEARAAAKAAQETAKNALLTADRVAADLKVHAADAEVRWASQAEKNSELGAGIDAATALAVTVKEPVVNPSSESSAPAASLTAEQSAALTEFTRVAKFAVGWAKQGRSRLVDGAVKQIAGASSYPVLKGIGATRIRAQVSAALVPREFMDTMLVSLQIQ